MNEKTRRNYLTVGLAATIAIILPLFLCGFIYPAFKVFLPEGNIVLTPTLRVIATFIIFLIDYAVASMVLYKMSQTFHNIYCHIIPAILTFLWNVFIGVIWYIAI